jgi:hypothetical protein
LADEVLLAQADEGMWMGPSTMGRPATKAKSVPYGEGAADGEQGAAGHDDEGDDLDADIQ